MFNTVFEKFLHFRTKRRCKYCRIKAESTSLWRELVTIFKGEKLTCSSHHRLFQKLSISLQIFLSHLFFS